ncbi:S-layer protein [Bacillus sp. Marseille-P3661]|uniref:S-layer protein n=1 Tax=Bacillus sp. Marseille-P3661 TaxID=1936234 RepID=UPI000C8431E8|nr:S-layer protein [Bacillus sp. Marseille-P3661]
MLRKILVILCFSMMLLPIIGNAEALYNQEDGHHYFFDKSSGFYIRLDTPSQNNISTNFLEEVKFTVLWYNRENSKPNFGYNGIAYGVMDVSYAGKSPYLKITRERYNHVYTIHDLDTQLTKTTTGYKIPIEIKNYDPKDKSIQNFKGESGKIDIELNYFNVDHSNAKYYVNFKDGADMKMFGDKLMLRFPKNSYIADNSLIAPIMLDQRLIVNVNEKPQPSNEYVFLSQQFTIDDSNGSLFAQPSTWGDITIAYDGVVPKAMEGYNLTVLKNNYGAWTPIGGVVNSANKTVTAALDGFGTYAIGLVYKDYGLKQHPAKKEILGLAYKGIIKPDVNQSDKALLTKLDKPIDRFTFTVLLSRALGFQPLDYTGVFSDIQELNYSQDELGYLMAGVMNGLVYGKESSIPGYLVMDPTKQLTREEAVAFLARGIELGSTATDTKKKKIVKKKKNEVELTPKQQLQQIYKDGNAISDWAATAVLAVTNEKILDSTTRFNPKGKLTNAEAMTMIYNLMAAKNLK